MLALCELGEGLPSSRNLPVRELTCCSTSASAWHSRARCGPTGTAAASDMSAAHRDLAVCVHPRPSPAIPSDPFLAGQGRVSVLRGPRSCTGRTRTFVPPVFPGEGSPGYYPALFALCYAMSVLESRWWLAGAAGGLASMRYRLHGES